MESDECGGAVVMAAYAVCAQVFQSSAERPFAINLLENNIWLEGQVNVPLTQLWLCVRDVFLTCMQIEVNEIKCVARANSQLFTQYSRNIYEHRINLLSIA